MSKLEEFALGFGVVLIIGLILDGIAHLIYYLKKRNS